MQISGTSKPSLTILICCSAKWNVFNLSISNCNRYFVFVVTVIDLRSHSSRVSVNARFDTYCSGYCKHWLIPCRHPFSVTPGHTFSWLCTRSQHSQSEISTHSSKYSYTNPRRISDTYPVDSNFNACCQTGFIHILNKGITMCLKINKYYTNVCQHNLFILE